MFSFQEGLWLGYGYGGNLQHVTLPVYPYRQLWCKYLFTQWWWQWGWVGGGGGAMWEQFETLPVTI